MVMATVPLIKLIGEFGTTRQSLRPTGSHGTLHSSRRQRTYLLSTRSQLQADRAGMPERATQRLSCGRRQT